MLLLIDNYDSFTYNLFQYLSELGEEVYVVRNDKITLEEIETKSPQRIVISPGPGIPEHAGISNAVIRRFGPLLPALGVCLGQQCIGYSYGAKIDQAGEIKHGKSSLIHHDGKGLFVGLSNPFPAIRYHSLAVMRETVPDCLEVTATSDDGVIQGIAHKDLHLHGVQFHPESIASEHGHRLIQNFLDIARSKPGDKEAA